MEDKDPIASFLENQGGTIELFKEEPEKDILNKFDEPAKEPVDTEEEPKTRKNIPFSEDPKVQRYVQKQIAKALENYKVPPQQPEAHDDSDTADVVEAFTNIIGNDTPEKVSALKSLERALKNVDQRASQIALQKIEEIRSEEANADQQAQEELAEAFDTIEDTYGVDLSSSTAAAKKTRNEFIDFIERISPKDANGDIVSYPDMNSAWETFSDMRKAQGSRAKEIASRGLTRSQEATPQSNFKPSFDNFDKFLETLPK